MITEDYVSFETANLLKEKGFECATHYYYDKDGDLLFSACRVDAGKNEFVAPTIQMAMKWLREKHNQNITVKAHNNIARLKTIYYAEVQNLSEPAEKGFCVNGCTFKETHEEACEAAIKYCLENLI